jgi:hypothetical protein
MKGADLKDILTRSRRAATSEDVSAASGAPSSNLVEEMMQAYAQCVSEDERRGKTFALLSRISSRDNVASGTFMELVLAFLKTRRLDQPHLLWRIVADSFPRSLLHYRVLHALIAGHFAHLGPLFRRDAFRYATHESGGVITDDFGERLRVLVALTANGRDLSPFETELGDVVTEWLTNQFDQLGPAHVRDLLGLLSRAVASTPAFLSAENKTLLLQRACVVASSLRLASQVPVVEACLMFLESVVQHGVKLPPHCLVPMVSSLCCTVNIDKLCDQSWRVGRGLLSSPVYGLETLDALCALLQQRRGLSGGAGGGGGSGAGGSATQNAGSVIRGAVFFVGMSCWGKDKVESLHMAPVTVLQAMVHAARCGYSVAAYEVLLSVRRLIRKQGPELTVEWDSIVAILYEMTAYTSANLSFVRVLVDTLSSLRALSDSNRFLADPQRQLWLLEAHATVLPPRDALRLLRTRLAQVPPLVTPEQLSQCLCKHLIEDKRTETRTAALAEVMEWLTHGSASGTMVDEGRAALVLPVWRGMIESLLATPQGEERGSLLGLLQMTVRQVADAAIGVRKHLFVECLAVLSSSHTVAASGGAKRNTVMGQMFDDAAAEGLARVFAAELAASRGRRARFVFDALVDLIAHPSVAVRQRALHYVSGLRADANFMVALFGQTSSVRIATSADSSKTEMSLVRAVETLTRQVRVETSKVVLAATFVTLQEWLWNRFVLRGVPLDFLALELCSILKEGRLPEPFRGQSQEALEHVKVMLQAGALLTACSDQFRQVAPVVSELIKAFVHLLRVPFAGGVFDAPGRASIQRLCLTGLCLAASHHPELLPPLAGALIEAVSSLVSVKFLDTQVPQVLNYLARFPTLVSALNVSQILNVLEGLLGGAKLAASSGAVGLWLLGYRLKTSAIWLLCVPPTERLFCYNKILPHVLALVGGPASLLAEAMLDWMASVVFLQFAPGRGALAASERFGFAGRPSVMVVQGNCVMEIVSGVLDWCMVTVWRPSGRVVWVTRILHNLSPLVPATLNQTIEGPIHQPYAALFRQTENKALMPGAASPVSQSLIVDAQRVSSPGGGEVQETSAPTSAVAIVAIGDLPPLNPKGTLEKKIPKPDLTDYFALESPRAGGDQQPHKQYTHQEGADNSYSTEGETDLRMAALFSYNEDDDVEEERDVFFGAHSLNGSRAQSMGSSGSVSPTFPTRQLPWRDSKQQQQAALYLPHSQSQQQHQQQQQQAPPVLEVSPPARRATDASLTPLVSTSRRGSEIFDRGTPSPSSPLTSRDRMRTEAAATTAAPHASVLFVQLRYIPFTDETPLLVHPTPTLQRALSVLDYMPPFETHKLGVLFVGKGQRTEAELFANQRGSVYYSRFLKGVGDTVRLQGYHGYTGGLDTEGDADGEFSVRFRDETLEVMLHCATMMPAGNFLAKKRHLGNDNVLIVWDESHEFDPKVLQSEFNMVSIVVAPIGAVARVSVFRKREMGHFAPVSLNQLVRVDALPSVVLHTAIHADREAQSLLSEEAVVGMALRLKQIRKIKTLAKQQHHGEQ